MAITIDYLTNEILIPKADTVFVSTDPITGRETRSLDMDFLWKALADIQDNTTDVWAPTAYINTPPQDLGGITLARSVLILDPYYVTFENGTYAVELEGGNTNLHTRTTVNSVAVHSNNSVGFAQIVSGSGVLPADITAISAAVWDKLVADHSSIGSFGLLLGQMQTLIDELHTIQGLDSADPVAVTNDEISSTNITIDITGNEDLKIMTRQ